MSKRNMVFVLFALFIVVIMATACGKGNPNGPTDTPTSPLFEATMTLVSARTGQPVSGATVTLPNGDLQSQSDGTFRVTGVPKGAIASVAARSFLSPRLRVTDSSTFPLWPADESLPEDFTLKAVYANNPSVSLIRPNPGRARVLVAHNILADTEGRKAVVGGVNSINNADQDISWDFKEDDGSTPGGFYVRMYIDPNDPYMKPLGAGALTYVTTGGDGIIVSAKVVLLGLRVFPGQHFIRAIGHELGHARGLSHTEGYPGMMWGGTPVITFSSREREVMQYMFMRPPGTRWPDNTSDVTRSSSSGKHTFLVCAFSQDGSPIE